MTLDMVVGLLCDISRLRGSKTTKMDPAEAAGWAKDGKMKGRTKDGQEFTAGIGGKTLTQMLWERENQKTEQVVTTKDERKAKLAAQLKAVAESAGVSSGLS
jgi:hypothetical protein